MTRKQMLIDALTVLASPAEAQLEHLRRLGDGLGVDELALDYDGIAAAAGDMLHHAELTATQCDAARKLNEYLDSMSGASKAHLWTPEALYDAREWADVRRMASQALRLFSNDANEA